MNYKSSVLKNQSLDKWFVPLILIIAGFVCFDFFSHNFSWVAFHEREFGRAADFILGKGLNHLGPEMSGGGNLPGPFLTLLFAIPVWIFKSPQAVHMMITLTLLTTAGLAFFLTKRHLGRNVAYLALALTLTNLNYVFFSFAGWHASFVGIINILVLYFYDRFDAYKNNLYLFLIGLTLGIGIQVHASLLILFPAYFLMLLIYKRGILPQIVFMTILGIAVTLTYYLFMDAHDEFANSKRFFDFFNENNLMSYGDNSRFGPLFSLKRIFLHFFTDQWKYIAYTNYFTNNINSIATTFQWLSMVWLLLGLCLTFYSDYVEKKRYLKIIPLLIVICIFPVFYRVPWPRFFLITHPAYEILLAISTLLIIHNLKSYKLTRFIVVAGITLFMLLNTFGIVYSKKDREQKSHVFIQRPKEKFATVNIVNYTPYFIFKNYLDLLVGDLKIHPEIYKNRYYFFHGEEDEPAINPLTPVPSQSHYEMAYYKAYPEEQDQPFDTSQDYGVVLVRKKDLNTFHSASINVVKTGYSENFVVFIYKGEYYYHQQHMYNDLSDEEERINQLDSGYLSSEIGLDKISVASLIEAPVSFKRLRYLHKLKLRQEGDHILGSSEIVGSDLRQSEYGKQSPYFIIDPVVKISFNDGTEEVIELLKNNFYSKTAKKGSAAYNRFGRTNVVNHLGNFYVPSPYGTAINIPARHLRDITEVVFTIKGFNTVIPLPSFLQPDNVSLADLTGLYRQVRSKEITKTIRIDSL